jgi:hypothetical protein
MTGPRDSQHVKILQTTDFVVGDNRHDEGSSCCDSRCFGIQLCWAVGGDASFVGSDSKDRSCRP